MNERQEKILEICNERIFVYLKDLSQLLPSYSLMTLRRDIDHLAEQGLLIKIRGGARRIDKVVLEDTIMHRMVDNLVQKTELAQLASQFCEKDGCVFFDSGSTINCLAKELEDIPLRVYTSGTNVAQELSQKQNVDVFLPGGRLNKRSLSISGSSSLSFFESINFHTVFMATSGYSIGSEFSCGSDTECELKRFVIKRASRVVMIADDTKFGKSLPYTFCFPSDIDVLVVSKLTPRKYIDYIKQQNPNIKILQGEPNED